jgi:hypothetical protein
MNIEASLPEVGPWSGATRPAVRADLERLETLWCDALAEHGGPMLFGEFGIADAFFAPIAAQTYALPMSDTVAAYVQRARLPGVKAWIDEALASRTSAFEEPYRLQRAEAMASRHEIYLVGGAVRDALARPAGGTATGWWWAAPPRPWPRWASSPWAGLPGVPAPAHP